MPPAEARNHAKSRILIPCSGNGLLCNAEQARVLDPARLRRHARAARRLAEHRLGVLAEQRRAAADLPARLVAEPFAGRVAEAAAELRDARHRRRSCASANARRARSRAACAAAPRGARHPAPRATACPCRSRRGQSAARHRACAPAPRRCRPCRAPGAPADRPRAAAAADRPARRISLSSGTRFFRSRAPMPWVMNQRPSLVWQMLGRVVRDLRRHGGRSAATAAPAA